MTRPDDTEPSAEALLASVRSAIMGVWSWEARGDKTNVEVATDIARAVLPILDRFRAAGVREWQPIETAPKGKIILLWAVTDRADNGAITNWKMGTGHTPFAGPVAWTWDGYRLREWDVTPTHWMPLPEPPHD